MSLHAHIWILLLHLVIAFAYISIQSDYFGQYIFRNKFELHSFFFLTWNSEVVLLGLNACGNYRWLRFGNQQTLELSNLIVKSILGAPLSWQNYLLILFRLRKLPVNSVSSALAWSTPCWLKIDGAHSYPVLSWVYFRRRAQHCKWSLLCWRKVIAHLSKGIGIRK